MTLYLWSTISTELFRIFFILLWMLACIFCHVTSIVHVRDVPVAFLMMLKGIIYSTGEIFVNAKMTQMISAAGLFTSSFGYVLCTHKLQYWLLGILYILTG